MSEGKKLEIGTSETEKREKRKINGVEEKNRERLKRESGKFTDRNCTQIRNNDER